MAIVTVKGADHPGGPRVLAGRWWLPSSPARAIAGTLTFATATGGLLELSDSLASNGTLPAEPLIYGRVEGAEVTICDGQYLDQRKRGWGTAGQVELETWRCGTVIVGAHADQGLDTTFDRFTVLTANMGPWVDRPSPQDVGGPGKVGVEVTLPEDVHADLGGGRGLRIAWRDRTSTDLRRQLITITIHSEVELTTAEPMTIAEGWHDLVSPLLAFTALATHVEDRVLVLRAHLAAPPPGLFPPQEHVELLDTDWQQTPTDATPEWSRTQLLPFASVLPRLGDVLRRWYDLMGTVPASVQDFAAAAFRPQVPIEERFIRIVRALETYHGGRIRGTYWEKAAYDRFLEKASEGLDAEQRAFLKMRLGHGNNRTLRQQLEDLFDLPPGDPLWILLHGRGYENFAQRVKKGRDNLTHNGALGPNTFDYLQLQWAELTLEWVYRRRLLVELGFDDEEIGHLIRRTVAHRRLHSPANQLNGRR